MFFVRQKYCPYAMVQRWHKSFNLLFIDYVIITFFYRIGGKNARATDLHATGTSIEPCRLSSLDMSNLCSKTSVAVSN